MQDKNILEVGKSLFIELDTKYDFFHIDEKNEDILKVFYKMFEPYFKQFAKTGLVKIEDKFNFDMTKFNILLMSMMKKVETFDDLTGPEKKELVIDAIIILVERELPIPQPYKFLLVKGLEVTLPILVDRLVEFSKVINKSGLFKKMKKKLKKLCCCGCC